MKRLSNLLAALVFASLVIFMSCKKGGGDDDTDVLAEAAANLTVSGWAPSQVVDPDDVNQTTEWGGFTLSFSGDKTGGTYSTDGVPEGFEGVWPENGSWTFGNDAGTVIIRDGDQTIDATITSTQLTLEFNFDSSARTTSIDGSWTFVFE